MNFLHRTVTGLAGIKVQFTVRPSGTETRAVVESRVHLKVSSVVFDLSQGSHPAGVVAVGNL